MIAASTWQQANQEFFEIALERVRARLTIVSGTYIDLSEMDARLIEIGERIPAPSAFHQLCKAFQLNEFESELILMCAAMEVLPRFGDLCAVCQQDPLLGFPTFGLAMAVLPSAAWVSISPAGVLRKLKLIEVEGGLSMVRNRIRISERLLHYLLGLDILDTSLGFVTRCDPVEASEISASAKKIRDMTFARVGQRAKTFQIIGRTAELSYIEACECIGLQPFKVDAANLPAEIDDFTDLWSREALLTSGALLVTGADAHPEVVTRLSSKANFPLYLAVNDRLAIENSVEIYLDAPVVEDIRNLWARALGEKAASLNGQLDLISDTFRLSPEQITSIAETVGVSDDVKAELWNACRTATRQKLDQLAQRIQSQMRWQDIVLADEQQETLKEIVSHVRHRNKVYSEWGFGERNVRGLGISALFSGPSGTGKTLAAEVIAGELNLDLYVIDLSQLVSKFIGETEKNLRRVFQAAEGAGAVLVFDEADAVFGQRSEVRDSHDRYANMEVSYLLQLTESYQGLVILTTNMRQSLDTAFMRRLRFVVHFQFPEYEQRRALWERAFPEQVPLDTLDYDALAKLNLTGGNIRSIAMNAAFRAAASAEPIGMRHVGASVRHEFAKLDKPIPEQDLAGDAW